MYVHVMYACVYICFYLFSLVRYSVLCMYSTKKLLKNDHTYVHRMMWLRLVNTHHTKSGFFQKFCETDTRDLVALDFYVIALA